MAITETVTDTPAESRTSGSDAGQTGFAVPAPRGLAGIVGSADHTTIGRIWIGASGVAGIGSAALAAWFLLEASGDAGAQTDRAFQNVTLAVLGLVLGFALPMFVGLATVVVPLQVGASTIAFPRAAAAALWTWLVSAGLLAVSYLPALDGGVGGGRVDGSVLTYLAVIGLVGSILLATVCVMTTVITLRPPGMGLDRVPLFSWSMVVAGGIWLLTLPMLAANAAFVAVDLKYGLPAQFGARDSQWTQLSWILTPPQVLAWVIPALGIVGDAVTTFARGGRNADPTARRLPQRALLLGAIGAFGAVSFGAHVQPAFDDFAFRQWATIAQVALGVLPVLAVLAVLGSALRRGLTAAAPLVLGLVSLLLILIATLVAVPFVIGPLDLQTTNGALLDAVPALGLATAGPPIYTWGVFGLVVAAVAAGAIAGLFHWGAKVTGRQLPAGLGKLLAPLLLAAGLLLGVPFLVLGFANRVEDLADSATPMLLGALAGALLLAVAVLAAAGSTVAARAAALGGAETAADDPWGTGATLEWATASPPAPGNFGELPVVTSAEPLLADAEARDGGAR